MCLTACAALLPAVGLTAGCAGGDQMQEKFYDATRGYNRSLRWADWDRAAEYVPPESADAFLDMHDAVDEELVVLEYNVTRLKLDKQNGRAASRVVISWHTDDRLIVEETTVDQWWQYFGGQWFLVDERRVDGTPLTIFAEREGPEDAEDLDGDGIPDEMGEEDDTETAALDHPYLPGLEDFRDSREIGLSEKEKRARERARRKEARRRKRAGEAPAMEDLGAPDSSGDDTWSGAPTGEEAASTAPGEADESSKPGSKLESPGIERGTSLRVW